MRSIRWVDGLIAGRYLILLAVVLWAVGSYWLIPAIEFDRSIENMFPPQSEVLLSYQRLKRTFGGNEIVLAVYHDADLFAADGTGVARVAALHQHLAAVAGVKAVLSIDQPLPGDLIVGSTPLAKQTRELFSGYTHSADGQTVALACLLYPPDETTVGRQQTIDEIRLALDELPEELRPGYLTGEPIMVVDGFRYVEADGRRLGVGSTILLGLTIVVCFRSLRWVVIPIAVVQLTLLSTQAALSLARIELSMVSSMLTAVVMVVGVATMVHVLVRFAELRTAGLDPLTAIRDTLRQLAPAIAWSCLTDAAGFAALTISDVGPVQDFGVMMAIGSLMVLVSVFALVPGLTTLGRFDVDPHAPWGEAILVDQLQALLAFVRRRPWVVLGSLATICVVAITGIGQLQVETDFTRNFRRDSDITMSYQFVEQNLGGAGICDIVIPAPAKLDWAFLQRVRQLGLQLSPSATDRQTELRSITKAFSVADAIVELSPVELSNKPRLVQDSLVFSGLTAMRGWMPEFFGTLYGVDPQNGQHYVRLMLRVHERQTAAEKQRLIAQVRQMVTAEFPDAEVTGYFVLLSHLIDTVLADQWRTFALALVSIGLLMTIAFRDRRLALVALIPNTFPVLVVLGTMGWLSRFVWPELRINMGTAMIAAVSMGLSIDSSIHYILGFKQALQQGLDFDRALQQIQRRIGKSMVLSTIALTVGFTVLATSRFVPTVYFGTLVTLAMLGGLVGNLIGLPLLMSLVRPHGEGEAGG